MAMMAYAQLNKVNNRLCPALRFAILRRHVGGRRGRLGQMAGNRDSSCHDGTRIFRGSLGIRLPNRENSASALGSAFAGAAASSEDPSIIANNPAGMIGLSGNQVSGDIGMIIPSAVFSGMGLTAARQPISGGNGGDALGVSLFLRLTGSMMPHPI